MALTDIYVWVDDEIIEYDDLNSIGEAVSLELGANNIPSSSIIWPFVAHGDIDMNGNDINNIGALLGVTHVNDDTTLTTALNNATDGSVIMIDPSSNTHTIKNIELSGVHDITIMGFNGASKVEVDATATNYGIRVDPSCTNIKIKNIEISGVAGKKSIWLAGGEGNDCVECDFTGATGHALWIGDKSVTSSVSKSKISRNNIDASTGIYIEGATESDIDHNKIDANGIAFRLPDETDGQFFKNNINYNTIDGGTAGFFGSCGTFTDNWGRNNYIGNKITGLTAAGAITLIGYSNEFVSGNFCDGEASFSLKQSNVVDNIIEETTGFGSGHDGTRMSNNRFEGDVTMTGGHSENTFVNNFFGTSFQVDSAMKLFMGNHMGGGVTTSGLPEEFGMNPGWD